MSLPEFSVKNHVLVNMLMLVILVAGSIFALTLVREMFPESRPNTLLITAVHPGTQPQEIEKAVTIKLEEAVRDIEGVDKVDSAVSEGISTTILTLLNEVKDVNVVLQEVKNEIDALQDLPDDLEQLTVRKAEPKLPVIGVALYGSGDDAGLKQAARDLRDELLTLPGISEVEITGTQDDEISVEIRPERLLEFNITFEEVADAIRRTNLDVSGGQLKGDRTSIAVRTLGEETRGEDLRDLVVRTQPDGRIVRLSDVAHIRDEFVESDQEAYFNGEPAVSCIVYKTGSQDAIQIATLVKAHILGKQDAPFDPYGFRAAYEQPWYWKPFALAGAWSAQTVNRISGRPDPIASYEASRRNPFNHNFQVGLHSDLARFVEGRLDLMTRNGKAGLILVLISLNLFLNWRVAFWAAIGLLVSFLGTFIVMWFFGATINLLSLFGLIIVLGIIVDDAIVIGENIYRHVEEGMPARLAAIRGAEEVMWPVTVAVLTTIGAFAPLFFITGQIGDFMGQLPIVVLAALSVSLIEALIILPSHLSHLPSRKPGQNPHERSATDPADQGEAPQPISSTEPATVKPSAGQRIKGALSRFGSLQERLMHGVILRTYERFLRFTLRWRYVTLAVAVSSVIMSFGLFAGRIVEWVFIQNMDSESLTCQLDMPVGTTGDKVKEQLIKLSHFVSQQPEVQSVQVFVARQYNLGGAGATGTNDQSHLGQLLIELRAADEREQLGMRSSEELLTEFRQFSLKLAGVNSVTWDALNGGPGGKDIEIKVTGKNFSELIQVAHKLKAELNGYAGVFDITDNLDEGKREVQLRLREAARPTGITVDSLGRHVRAATYGAEARRITRNREDVRIMVRYPENFREDVYNLETMWIPTQSPDGSRGWVPLGQVAELTDADSYTTIHRSRQQRSVTVFGEVDQEVAESSEILTKVRETFDREMAPAHPGVAIEFLGRFEEQQKSFAGLKLAFPVALLLIYMMLCGLFRSYVQPMVVMAAIPFGIQGAIVGHWLTGNPMTILSGIGLVALAGILVNDSLVLVDFINQRVRNGLDHFEASVQGAKLRLRAILLTTMTTVAGLTPMMFETSFQAKFLIPMAVTLTFGLIFATGLTLIIVPSLNLVFYDFRRFLLGDRHEVEAEQNRIETADLVASS